MQSSIESTPKSLSMLRTATSLLLLTLSCAAWGQVARDTELFKDLQAQDRTFFELGFNACDLEYLEAAVHPDLRFYHDQGGFQDRDAFFENTRKYICATPDRKPIRKVDAESLEVFPLHRDGVLYGAIQRGLHHFYLREAGKPDVHTSSARFTHVYVLEEGRWLLREVLSYDHQSPGD